MTEGVDASPVVEGGEQCGEPVTKRIRLSPQPSGGRTGVGSCLDADAQAEEGSSPSARQAVRFAVAVFARRPSGRRDSCERQTPPIASTPPPCAGCVQAPVPPAAAAPGSMSPPGAPPSDASDSAAPGPSPASEASPAVEQALAPGPPPPAALDPRRDPEPGPVPDPAPDPSPPPALAGELGQAGTAPAPSAPAPRAGPGPPPLPRSQRASRLVWTGPRAEDGVGGGVPTAPAEQAGAGPGRSRPRQSSCGGAQVPQAGSPTHPVPADPASPTKTDPAPLIPGRPKRKAAERRRWLPEDLTGGEPGAEAEGGAEGPSPGGRRGSAAAAEAAAQRGAQHAALLGLYERLTAEQAAAAAEQEAAEAGPAAPRRRRGGPRWTRPRKPKARGKGSERPPVGTRIWVKTPGFCAWPAVVFSIAHARRLEVPDLLASYVPECTLVHFYGEHNHVWLPSEEVAALAAEAAEAGAEAERRQALEAWSARHKNNPSGPATLAELDGAEPPGEQHRPPGTARRPSGPAAEAARLQRLRDARLAAAALEEVEAVPPEAPRRRPQRFGQAARAAAEEAGGNWEMVGEEYSDSGGEEAGATGAAGAAADGARVGGEVAGGARAWRSWLRVCACCGQDGAQLTCYGCRRVYHTLCLSPPVLSPAWMAPGHAWACAGCGAANTEPDATKAKPEAGGEEAERLGLTPDWLIHAGAFRVFQLQPPTSDAPFIRGLLDPCTNSKTNPNIPAEVLYDKADDGLRLANRWAGRHVILNPEFTSQTQWRFVNRAIDEVESGSVPAVLLVCRNSTDTAYFQRLRPYPRVMLRRGRCRFKDYSKSPIGFGIAVFCIARLAGGEATLDLYRRFVEAFAERGEPNIPIDRAFVDTPAFPALLGRLADHTVRHLRDSWAQCSDCHKWRLVPFEAYSRLTADPRARAAWTCADLGGGGGCLRPQNRAELHGVHYVRRRGAMAAERQEGLLGLGVWEGAPPAGAEGEAEGEAEEAEEEGEDDEEDGEDGEAEAGRTGEKATAGEEARGGAQEAAPEPVEPGRAAPGGRAGTPVPERSADEGAGPGGGTDKESEGGKEVEEVGEADGEASSNAEGAAEDPPKPRAEPAEELQASPPPDMDPAPLLDTLARPPLDLNGHLRPGPGPGPGPGAAWGCGAEAWAGARPGLGLLALALAPRAQPLYALGPGLCPPPAWPQGWPRQERPGGPLLLPRSGAPLGLPGSEMRGAQPGPGPQSYTKTPFLDLRRHPQRGPLPLPNPLPLPLLPPLPPAGDHELLDLGGARLGPGGALRGPYPGSPVSEAFGASAASLEARGAGGSGGGSTLAQYTAGRPAAASAAAAWGPLPLPTSSQPGGRRRGPHRRGGPSIGAGGGYGSGSGLSGSLGGSLGGRALGEGQGTGSGGLLGGGASPSAGALAAALQAQALLLQARMRGAEQQAQAAALQQAQAQAPGPGQGHGGEREWAQAGLGLTPAPAPGAQPGEAVHETGYAQVQAGTSAGLAGPRAGLRGGASVPPVGSGPPLQTGGGGPCEGAPQRLLLAAAQAAARLQQWQHEHPAAQPLGLPGGWRPGPAQPAGHGSSPHG
ncbi:hypothetical protein HYH03_015106 [Edaphochlamys debaryana]|uniref:PWWP domain-containing protein n=1 Tax=Edaphochlamys debaryana TaxID=47281 RepID=A0A835XMN7_9CHLO|nr:hypothetical protein HYH03_015106 [Edaphochlamys debaryana]|eukprot:KAG2486142.1 hypothetical protein HYH03_015106 [Edaphochlamys debaryana]